MRCANIVCIDKKPDLNTGKIFFGDYDHYIRIDYVSHELAKNLKETAEGNTWFTKELNYVEDARRWQELPDKAQRIFQLNINYQNLMDSGVANGFLTILSPIITSPIWQLLYIKIGYEEAIHSESYSYALNHVFGAKANQILDMVYNIPFIKTRLINEVDNFAEVKRRFNDSLVKIEFWNEIKDKLPSEVVDKIEREVIAGLKDLENDDNKKAILKLIFGNLMLEGVKFPLSFYITWNINKQYNNPIQGISRLLRLIAIDELQIHVPVSTALLRILKKESNQGFKHLFDNGWFEEYAINYAKEIAQKEFEWIDFLLEEGEIPGFTKDIGYHFVRYMIDLRLKNIGLPVIYNEEKSDIIKWFDEYRDPNNMNTALQEADNISYQKGNLENDLETFDFKHFLVSLA